MVHNSHVHGLQFRIITGNGNLPPKNKIRWQDTVALSGEEEVRILIKPYVSLP